MCEWQCIWVCLLFCVIFVCLGVFICFWGGFCLHDKAVLETFVYLILWFSYNVMDVVNAVMFYLVTISDAIHDFLTGDNNDLLNWIESLKASAFFFAYICFCLKTDFLLCPSARTLRITLFQTFLCMWLFSQTTGRHILTSGMVHAGCVSVAGIHLSNTWTSGSLYSDGMLVYFDLVLVYTFTKDLIVIKVTNTVDTMLLVLTRSLKTMHFLKWFIVSMHGLGVNCSSLDVI